MAEFLRINQITERHQKQKLTYVYQEFYPSVSKKLLKDLVLFVQTHTDINRKDIEVIFYYNIFHYFMITNHGLTKDSNGDIDVTMGSYDRAEVCELVGLFMLNELLKKFDKDNIGLYRDDGLSVFKNHNGHQNDKFQKELIDLFKQHHMNLQVKCNLKIVNYFDIMLDLTTGLFK